jgi:sugar O-acyltransferase (sialic acid O-acetyltransferase NeuD family)
MKTFIFGASGFAKEVEWLIYEINNLSEQNFSVHGFVVHDSEFEQDKIINGIEIISESIYFEKYHNADVHNCIIAVGSGALRKRIFNKISSKKTIFPNLIHPSVLMDKRFVEFGEGLIICAGTILTTNIILGKFVQINLSTSIGHDSNIGDFVTISPGVSVSGNVTILSDCFIGTGAKILENIVIEKETIIGSGAVVTKSIDSSGTYVGVPAKKIK